MLAARRRIVARALESASRDERDDDEGPMTLRSEQVAAVLQAKRNETLVPEESAVIVVDPREEEDV
jgi:hypothetical protein